MPNASIRSLAWRSLLITVAGCGRLVGADFNDLKPMAQNAGPPETPAGVGPEICTSCVPAKSCIKLPHTCGPNADQDCCTSYIVPGGAFKRDNHPGLRASVSRFALDAYEVTVGRFRTFLAGFPESSRPFPGDGQHPMGGTDTGWQQEWDPVLPPSSAYIEGVLSRCNNPKAWTNEPGENENRPIACVNWYLAFAFCAWDEGRLPTEAEWSFAAVGGNQQRLYPWSLPGTEPTIGTENGSFDCAPRSACASLDSVLAVGTRPAGNGRWGHADLLGNLWEWTLDPFVRCVPCGCRGCAVCAGDAGDACPACVNCTNPSPDNSYAYRIIHGAGFATPTSNVSLDRSRTNFMANFDNFSFANDIGFRCARDP